MITHTRFDIGFYPNLLHYKAFDEQTSDVDFARPHPSVLQDVNTMIKGNLSWRAFFVGPGLGGWSRSGCFLF